MALLIEDVISLTATKVRVVFDSPVTINDALLSPFNYIFDVLTAGAIAVVPRSVTTPVGFFNPSWVDVTVSEHTNAASYQVAITSNIISSTGEDVGDETPFGYTGAGDPPVISRVVSSSKTEVVVEFDEIVFDGASVRNIENYTWDNGLVTVSVKTVAGSKVILETSDQSEGVLYTLTIFGQLVFELSDSISVSDSIEAIDPSLILWAKAVSEDITESAGDVTAWVNKVGSAGSTAGNNPEWISSSPEFGGHGVVSFDKSDSEIFNFNDIAASVQGEDLPLTVIVAARYTGDIPVPGTDIMWGFGHLTDVTPPEISGHRVNDTTRVQLIDDAGLVRFRATLQVPDNNASVYSFVFPGGEPVGELFRDLIRMGSTGASSFDAVAITPNSFSMGGLCQGSTSGDVFGDVDIAEIMIFTRELSEDVRKGYVRQMASDKGITIPEEKLFDFESFDNSRQAFDGAATDATGVIQNEPVEVYDFHVPRMRIFPNGTRYLLSEGERVNHLIRSREFADAIWLASGVDSVDEEFSESPEGEILSAKIVSNQTPFTINGISQIVPDGDFDVNEDYTFSCFIKKFDADSEYALQMKDLDGMLTKRDVSKIAWPIETWVRDSVTDDIGSATADPQFRLRDNIANLNGTTRVQWGAQVEKGSFPSSLIITGADPVTRNGDNFSIKTKYVSDNILKGIFSFKFIPLWSSSEVPNGGQDIIQVTQITRAWKLRYSVGVFRIAIGVVDYVVTGPISFERYEEALITLDGEAGTLTVTGFSGVDDTGVGLVYGSTIPSSPPGNVNLNGGFYWMGEPTS